MSFTPVDHFDYSRLYGDEKYSLQNMLLKEVNMPTDLLPGDWVNEAWSDRLYNEWREAAPLLVSNMNHDAMLAGATDQSFLAFCSKIFSMIEGREIKLTGAAAVRYTDGGGYPCIRFTGVVAQDVSGRHYGIPIKRRVSESKWDMFGGCVDFQQKEW